MAVIPRAEPATLLTVCEHGYGKRTPTSDYPTKNRGGKGVISIKTTARNGEVRGVRVVSEDDHVILISDRGKLIRIRMRDVSVQGRATQGVRLMRLEDGESVAAIERLAEPGDESGIAEAAPLEIVDDSDTIPVDMEGDGDDADDESDDDGDDAGDDDDAAE
jgi:DNA gyrase subunit A